MNVIKDAVALDSSRSIMMTRTRLFLGVITALNTIAATWVVAASMASDGWTFKAVLIIPLFALLFGLVAFSFWMASLGLVRRLLASRSMGETKPRFKRSKHGSQIKTAILVPVYNESPTDVIAGVIAMRRSLLELGGSAAFEFFILSDTTKESVWKEEERLWAKAIDSDNTNVSIFYRRRPENIGRKSGNLEDFCVRWGQQYEYMIVLDADSLMDAATMQAMVDRMNAKPRLGILQVPPVPINRLTLFARLQQFAASVYGPTFTEGLKAWASTESNYWGHNAIIRVEPFMQHCGLPILPGKAPLGGEILSHDFVEAALMLRANWDVELANDLGGSYEECPTNLLDFAVRDQRWCQGNMQHARLVFSEGFHPTSRFHMAMGVLSYLASPLWLAFMMLTLWIVSDNYWSKEPIDKESWFTRNGPAVVFAMTMVMLVLPKLWGWVETVSSRERRRTQGGGLRLMASILIESLVSCLMAPAMMVFHTRFVFNTLRGRKITWNSQNRDESQLSWSTAWKNFGVLSVVGMIVSGIVLFSGVQSLWWFLPISLGWAATMPLAIVSSRVSVGRYLQRWKLLLIPEETNPPTVLLYKQIARSLLESLAENETNAGAKIVAPHYIHSDKPSSNLEMN